MRDAPISNRILVVEDDPDVREVLAEVLLGSGYDVGTARHGHEALQWLELSDPPTLIVLDLMMPVMNGYELLMRLRDTPGLREIPVVVLSAAVHQFEELDEGVATVILRKPVRMETLLATVEQICAAGSGPVRMPDTTSQLATATVK